jgi:hypothetical protein
LQWGRPFKVDGQWFDDNHLHFFLLFSTTMTHLSENPPLAGAPFIGFMVGCMFVQLLGRKDDGTE